MAIAHLEVSDYRFANKDSFPKVDCHPDGHLR